MRKPFSARADQDGVPGPPSWSGRTKRIVASAAASAVLLGGGTAIGVAMTGGASAATSGTPASASTAAQSVAAQSVAAGPAAAGPAAARCARITARLSKAGRTTAAGRLALLCHSRLLRLALVGGEHGEVTFKAKSGTKTMAFERGTLETVSGSEVTVMAADGTTWTWQLTSATVVRSHKQKVSSTRLGKGELVLVAGPVVNGANDARVIRIRPAS